MEETIILENLIRTVKSKIESHNEFKKEYDKQLAFDFNFLNFFFVGENKISEILGYFLNPKEKHGQSTAFLSEFIKLFFIEDIDLSEAYVVCEHCIDNNRRIDLFIKLKDRVIAIENKLWAVDQINQLNDYSKYLDKISGGKYLLLYLNPEGSYPSINSMRNESMLQLQQNKQFDIISYKLHILELIDKWILICNAEKVTQFLKQFREYLKTKFYGSKTMNITSKMKELILSNQTEVETLIEAYKEIERKQTQTLDNVGAILNSTVFHERNFKIEKVGSFNWEGFRVYKIGISNANNKIWIQLVKDKINLELNYYFENGSDLQFKEFIDKEKISKRILDRNLSKIEIANMFIERVEFAINTIEDYSKS
jgi:hypothetical protein